ncbi:MAG: hypothetical protein IJ555_04595 [Ruminococcus sp.]|nr:hypothetical protein [Ruminococcus sp.]
MDNRKFRNGMLFGILGAILTLLGDLLIGANSASDITTGSQMVDMFIDAASYILAWAIGKNAVGNGIGTGAISIGHLYMFTMFLADMPKEWSDE